MKVQSQVKQVFLAMVVLIALGGCSNVYGYEMTFTIFGQIDLEEGGGIDCLPFENLALQYPYLLVFGLPTDTFPDSYGPDMTDVYYIDGADVEFYIGEQLYPVAELVLEIGDNYMGVLLNEYDGLFLEYYWDATRFYTSGSLEDLCPPIGTATLQPYETFWSDYDCWGYTLYTSFQVKCELPSWNHPDVLLHPGELRHPDLKQN